MIDREKEAQRLEAALGNIRGMCDALELLYEESEPGQSHRNTKTQSATMTILYGIERLISDADHSAYALTRGRYCDDDPQRGLKVVS